MTIEPEDNPREIQKLRDLMQKADRVKAPWYFQALLQQRLASTGDSGVRSFRPLLAIPVTAIVAAAILYLSFPPQPESGTPLPDGLVLPGLPPDQEDQSQGAVGESSSPSLFRDEDAPAEARESSRGPSDERPEPIRPASIQQRESAPGPGDASVGASARQMFRQSSILADSLIQSVPDSLDSLRQAADSALVPDEE